MEGQVLFTGDISTYRRNTFLLGIMYSGFAVIIAGFSLARYLGLIMIIVILGITIYMLWTITPESRVIRFTDEDIVIYDKGIVTGRISYGAVTKFEYNNRYRTREYLKLSTNTESFSFNPSDGDSWEKLADGISNLLRSKNTAIKIIYHKFLDRWRNE